MKYFVQEDSNISSTVYKNIIVFEYINNSFEKEINLRRVPQNFFSETEVWDLLKGSINGLAYF